MIRRIIPAVVVVAILGCSSSITKSFKVTTDPPDSVITVVSGPELNVMKFRSPATITAELPKDPRTASKAVLEVSRDSYKPRTIALRDIREGQALNIKLDRISHAQYRLGYRLASPAPSDTLQFRDNVVSVSFSVTDQSFQLRFENLTPEPIKIIWERAQYTDANNQTSRLMHSGIRFQDRNNPIPDQVVQPRAVLQEALFPISNVFVTGGRRTYDIKPLFRLDSETAADLKGRAVILFLPVEVNRAITAYNFKIEISDAVKESSAK